MTALAVVGSATSTSLTSRGSSMTTDFPTPSGTKRELASLLTRRMTDAGASAAGTLVCAAGHDPAIATANNAAFFSVDCAIVVSLFVVSSRVSYGSDAKPDQIDAAAVVLRFVDCDFLAFEIDNAAQNE